ncbi:MAG: SAM-dependent methyltransferase [Chloroflexota bacterium]|nr:SAM-dependent methyltransferase [Chloroflexota bacterium]
MNEDGPNGRLLPGAASVEVEPASWRDPGGFVYRRKGVVHRQIQPSFAAEWEHFLGSGLHARLVERGMLVGHADAKLEDAFDGSAHAVIRPEPIDFVAYPYEWTFGELRDAALLTLDAQLEALSQGMTLRDASAYNVQFRGVQPVLIDSLSFERLEPDAPWIAYQQFCEHFLAPLALMATRDIRCGRLLRSGIDGIPLDLAAGLLPARSRLRLGLGAHLHLHARSMRRHADASGSGRKARLSLSRQVALIESLRSTVSGLTWEPEGTEWADYADHTSYDDEATRSKESIVGAMLGAGSGGIVWDLGANTGRYSAIASRLGRRVVSFDIDPAAAERHYRSLRREGRTDTTPLVMDLADPSPALGWAHRERRSLEDRAGGGVLMALALVHHLAIGRNVPLPMLLDWLAKLGSELIIEWVPREDAMAQRLLAAREDIFQRYTEDGFQAALAERWVPVDRVPIIGTARVLYHLRQR